MNVRVQRSIMFGVGPLRSFIYSLFYLCLLLLGTRDPSLDLSPATLIARVYFTNKYS